MGVVKATLGLSGYDSYVKSDVLIAFQNINLGWRQANTAEPSAIPPPNFAYNLSILKTFCDI